MRNLFHPYIVLDSLKNRLTAFHSTARRRGLSGMELDICIVVTTVQRCMTFKCGLRTSSWFKSISSFNTARQNGLYPSLDLITIDYGVTNFFETSTSHKFLVHNNEFISFIHNFVISPL